MPFTIYITRQRYYFDDDGPSITPEEWARYVAGDPDMDLTGVYESEIGGHVHRETREGLALWHGYSCHRAGESDPVPFRWLDGNIFIVRPDNEIAKKVWRVADALGAHVQDEYCGEAEEEYDAGGWGPEGYPPGAWESMFKASTGELPRGDAWCDTGAISSLKSSPSPVSTRHPILGNTFTSELAAVVLIALLVACVFGAVVGLAVWVQMKRQHMSSQGFLIT